MTSITSVSIIMSIAVVIVISVCLWYFTSSRVVTLASGGVERYYLLSGSTHASQSVPLVIMLHGYGDHPRLAELYTGWSKLARDEGFIVAYPYGIRSAERSSLSWNAGSCCGAALVSESDDVAYIRDVVEHISQTHTIDRSRVYIVGFSNGGIMTHRVLASDTRIFAAGAVVAGSVGGRVLPGQEYYSLPAPAQSRPVMLIHGADDVTVPYRGGVNHDGSGEFASFDESVAYWIRHNQCKPSPTRRDTAMTQELRYTECPRDTIVTAITAADTGHTWPGNPLDQVLHPWTKRYSATREIWTYFRKFHR